MVDDVVDSVDDAVDDVVDDAPEETENAESAGDPDYPEDNVADDVSDEEIIEDVVDEPVEDVVDEPVSGDDSERVLRDYTRQAMNVDTDALRQSAYLRDKFTKTGVTALLRFFGGGRGGRGLLNLGTGAVGAMTGELVTGLGTIAVMWGSEKIWDKLKPFVASAGTSDMAVRAFEILANDAVEKGVLRGFRFGRAGVDYRDEAEDTEKAQRDAEDEARKDEWR